MVAAPQDPQSSQDGSGPGPLHFSLPFDTGVIEIDVTYVAHSGTPDILFEIKTQPVKAPSGTPIYYRDPDQRSDNGNLREIITFHDLTHYTSRDYAGSIRNLLDDGQLQNMTAEGLIHIAIPLPDFEDASSSDTFQHVFVALSESNTLRSGTEPTRITFIPQFPYDQETENLIQSFVNGFITEYFRPFPTGSGPALTIAKDLRPRDSDIIVYSSDSAFSLGPLQSYVLKDLQVSEREKLTIFNDAFFELYTVPTKVPVDTGNPHILGAVVSIRGTETSSNAQTLANSFDSFLRNLGPSVSLNAQTSMWIPLMGTGSAGLTYIASATLIKNGLDAVRPSGLLPDTITQINISLPPEITAEDEAEVVRIFEQDATQTPRPPSRMPNQFHPDRPVVDPENDDLGRDAIAAAIVSNVTHVWPHHRDNNYPFAVHISGRWGSGKSSVLSFLKKRLSAETSLVPDSPGTIYPISKKGWIVAEYNAWQMQDNGPAWWSLLTAVSEQTYKDLEGRGTYLRLMDRKWHFLKLMGPWIYVALALLILVVGSWVIGTGDDVTQTLTTEATSTVTTDGVTVKTTDKAVDPIKSPNALFGSGNTVSFIIAAITALGSIGVLAKLLTGFTKTSSETAEAIRNLNNDPTATLKDRYKKIIKSTERPIAVFIDDLDRCDAQFVVDLLQSLQTAYADVPVLYVVAADRDWIVSAHNQIYKGFKDEISRPEAPLGLLFVKKIFQLPVHIPELAGGMMTTLTQSLLKSSQAPKPQTETKEARIASVKAAAARGDTAQIAAIQEDAISQGQNITTEVMQAIVNPQAQAVTAHKLLDYTHLFDTTPRAVKLLINALTFRQGYILSAAQDISFDVVTRWTILTMRFPYTADYLASFPAKVDPRNRSNDDAAHFPYPEEIYAILHNLTEQDIAAVAAFG